jgi:hypothetical protein
VRDKNENDAIAPIAKTATSTAAILVNLISFLLVFIRASYVRLYDSGFLIW